MVLNFNRFNRFEKEIEESTNFFNILFSKLFPTKYFSFTSLAFKYNFSSAMLRVHPAAFPARALFRQSVACMSPDMSEAPMDQMLSSRPRKGPPVAHNLDVYKKMHKLHHSAKWKQANVVPMTSRVKDMRIRESHREGRYDPTDQYRDWLYGNDRRYVNIVGFVLGVMSITIFFYTIQFLGSDKWDMPAPLLKKPDLVVRGTGEPHPKTKLV